MVPRRPTNSSARVVVLAGLVVGLMVLAGLAIAIILFYGAWRVTSASADAGAFFSFVVAMLMAYEPGKRLASVAD